MMQKLNKIPDKNPFKVPDNYFEEVNRKIISATAGYNQEVKKSGLFLRFRPYLLIAASVTGFIILSYAAMKLIIPDKLNTQIAEVLFEYPPEIYMDNLDILTLELTAAALDLFEELPEVNNTDIIDYLLLENIEINDIYEQL